MKNKKQSEKTNSGGSSAFTLEELQKRLNNSDVSDDDLSSITGGGDTKTPDNPKPRDVK
jgi:hypothetical protein